MDNQLLLHGVNSVFVQESTPSRRVDKSTESARRMRRSRGRPEESILRLREIGGPEKWNE